MGFTLAPHLNKKLFTQDIEEDANRMGFGIGLREAGERDSRIVALCADLTESTRIIDFKEKFPERFFEVGIGEQSMASVASGMAAMGKIPFIASYAMFSPGRSWEQVRTTVAYNDANVKVIGAHAGVSVGPDGATHQAIEDVALMRVIPRMRVIAPCDTLEAKRATHAIAESNGPAYMRLTREKTPIVTTEQTSFALGKAETYLFRDPAHEKKVGIIASGVIIYEALKAAKRLNEQGVGASVMNLATVKPLDGAAVLAFAEEHGTLITVEEHQRMGGMGSAVAEYLSATYPTKVIRLGVDDRFGESGNVSELWKHFGLDAEAIVVAAHGTLGTNN
jgi:transketolase